MRFRRNKPTDDPPAPSDHDVVEPYPDGPADAPTAPSGTTPAGTEPRQPVAAAQGSAVQRLRDGGGRRNAEANPS